MRIISEFNIPVVLFLFKRKDTVLQIIDVLREVQPQKLYLMSDAGRNEEENKLVYDVRKSVEISIDWDCEIIKNYASYNRGVYQNIGCGASWVFEREEKAIFLEDDNLPELTFFIYCENLLNKYKYDDKVLWICGTNYLGEYENDNNESYMFTQHLLPCGWASWSEKFSKYYDSELNTFEIANYMKQFKRTYTSNSLYKQQFESINAEFSRKKNHNKFVSWDYQMLFSLRSNDMYGISPSRNQIKNIGADEFSIHGGTSLDKIMTKRFCEIHTTELTFPLIHPQKVKIDQKYEKKTGNIILLPFSLRVKLLLNRKLKLLLSIDPYSSLSKEVKRRFTIRK